jgi:hypothetical protein
LLGFEARGINVGQKVNLDKRSGVFFGYKHRLNNSMPHCVPTCSPFFVLFYQLTFICSNTHLYLLRYCLGNGVHHFFRILGSISLVEWWLEARLKIIGEIWESLDSFSPRFVEISPTQPKEEIRAPIQLKNRREVTSKLDRKIRRHSDG